MGKIKNKKWKVFLTNIMWALFVIVVSTIISFFIHGPKLFSSLSYYLEYTPLGFAYGFAFMVGNKIISNYTKKLNWKKNLKRANVISLSMYIIYGIIVSVMVPYLYDRYYWNMTGDSLFIDVSVKALMGISLEMTFIAIYYSTYLTKYWKESIEANEELKRENLLATYEALKNQVDPHFLFNSLNTLSGVVEQKPELAPDFIKKLSDIYRYVLEQNDKELISINDEMKFVEDYIFLSKMRFGEALLFKSNLSDKITIQIVPLGIQMLVENAIKHNIIADDMPLNIEIGIEGDYLIVRNNIQKKKTIHPGKEPLGLENLKKRYAYLSDASVEIIESDSKFIVKLPIIEA
jgi:two-component system LytT family sensor kinase